MKIKLHEFTDPACTWCWGSEPILKKLETHFGDQLEISYIMGGLVENAYNFYDRQNNIGGDLDEMNKQIAKHWLEASSRHGMPVMVEDFHLMTPDHYSTYPMNIAYKAAEFMDKDLADKLLRRIREAVTTEGLQANDPQVLIKLAVEIGLERDEFEDLFLNGRALQAFEADKNFTISKNVFGFPSYLIVNEKGEEILLRGYQEFGNFVRMIEKISSNEVSPVKPQNGLGDVKSFVEKYGKVAPIEILKGLDLTADVLEEYIDELVMSGDIELQKVGNGYFVLAKEPNSTCDAKTGMCGF